MSAPSLPYTPRPSAKRAHSSDLPLRSPSFVATRAPSAHTPYPPPLKWDVKRWSGDVQRRIKRARTTADSPPDVSSLFTSLNTPTVIPPASTSPVSTSSTAFSFASPPRFQFATSSAAFSIRPTAHATRPKPPHSPPPLLPTEQPSAVERESLDCLRRSVCENGEAFVLRMREWEAGRRALDTTDASPRQNAMDVDWDIVQPSEANMELEFDDAQGIPSSPLTPPFSSNASDADSADLVSSLDEEDSANAEEEEEEEDDDEFLIQPPPSLSTSPATLSSSLTSLHSSPTQEHSLFDCDREEVNPFDAGKTVEALTAYMALGGGGLDAFGRGETWRDARAAEDAGALWN
ncbi:hypothetical protein BOTBODRAFT_176037 [Botryobasidium botryosum FD-172 SS1]|uniref:Uncharacterized protein n=1 Tax=Botryobasidium botryosum (strain FD-172 SS1) TaxID=930990 RepID=A0A067MAX2_BOTB1|nr:hypothetical protein BOTBODRAFT_176037 [Botryobasidium botryosum FD-172 SS1]